MAAPKGSGKKQNDELTDLQKHFAERYAAHGNASRAAREAGYAVCSSPTSGQDNLSLEKVQKYLAELRERQRSQNIADMDEIQEYWTQVMRDKEESQKDRMRASENLAKSYGAFIEKVEGKLDTKINIIIE